MKEIVLYVLLQILVLGSMAQVISVVPDEAELDGIRRKGVGVVIELDKKLIEKAYVKKLKETGKTEVNKTGSITIKPINLPSLPSTLNATGFARADQGPKGTRVFLAIDLPTEPIALGHPAWEELKKFLYDFALQCYRDDLNTQISEGDKAVDAAVKLNESSTEEGHDIKRKIERNQVERTRLLQQMSENESELLKLKGDSVQNKIIQISTFEEIQKLQKIVEDKKTKLGNLN
jgi:hypothetical protein